MSLVPNLKVESDSIFLIDMIHQDNLKDHTISTLVSKIKKLTKKRLTCEIQPHLNPDVRVILVYG